MPLTVHDICRAMDTWAPPGLAYEWDRVGLQIGEPDKKVSRVLTCLTVDHAAFAAARRAKAEMIVAHHPVIWDPLKKLRTDDPQTRLCLDIAGADMACFAAHTNLDVVPGGVNTVLAEALGLKDQRPLFPAEHARQLKLVTFVPETHLAPLRTALADAGAGVIGDYRLCSFNTAGTGTFVPGKRSDPFLGARGILNEEREIRLEMVLAKARLAPVLTALLKNHPYEEPAYDLIVLDNPDPAIGLGVSGVLAKTTTLEAFAQRVTKALQIDHLRFIGDAQRKVRQAAVLGGSGGGQIAKLPPGIDVYVTGDVKYHDAAEAAARGIAVIDAGHAGTEKAIASTIAKHLKQQFKELKTTVHSEAELFQLLRARK